LDTAVAPVTKPAPEPGVVAASVYALERRIVDIAVEEAGKWARLEAPRRLDRVS